MKKNGPVLAVEESYMDCSPYGTIIIEDPESILRRISGSIRDACERTGDRPVRIGLTGGSTPKAFYRWCIETGALVPQVWSRCIWATSDERHVSHTSSKSNFGNADRLLLEPLGVPRNHKFLWPTQFPARDAAAEFNRLWQEEFGKRQGFDVCFLGMGGDGHTASIFPHSPLIAADTQDLFAAVEVPRKGWRLTITPAGLSCCSSIVVCVLGESKAEALEQVLHGDYDPESLPIQLLRDSSERVTWLVDRKAAADL